MTVSRALNKPHLVSEAFRQRILDAVAKTGYVPNRAASGLASGGVALIPIILPTLHHSVYVSLLDGLHSVLPKAGFEILVSCTEYMTEREETLVAAPHHAARWGVSPVNFSSRKWRNAQHPANAPSILDSGWSSARARKQFYETDRNTRHGAADTERHANTGRHLFGSPSLGGVRPRRSARRHPRAFIG
jgi:hypothetical protein